MTDQAASSANGSHGGSSGLWEAQAVLLLWLSILILIPFDLVILDSSVTDSNGGAAAAQAGYPPLAAKVMALCQDFLSQPGATNTHEHPQQYRTHMHTSCSNCWSAACLPPCMVSGVACPGACTNLLQLLPACRAAEQVQVPCARWQHCCWRGC